MISGVVYTALRSLVNDRCYPNAFPQEAINPPGTTTALLNAPTWPSIRYQIVTSVNEATICGTDDTSTDNTRVQIDVVARTYGAMIALCDQVITALMTTDPPCTRENLIFFKDEATDTHQGIMQFVFYASSAAGSP